MSVNVSATAIHDSSFTRMVTDALSTSGVPADRLTLEITEGALADQTDVAISAMHELRALGVRLAVDDFGSGYSSMAYLKRLPIDELKIDKAFVLEMLTDKRDQPITRSIIELGHSLGLTVVAEGVESPALEEILRLFGCDVVQGFGICRPRAADELTEWLAKHAPTRASPGRSRAGTAPPLRIVGT